MNESTKLNVYLIALATFVAGGICALFLLAKTSVPVNTVPQLPSGQVVQTEQNLGGLVHNIQETFDAGIAVNGTEVISSARAIKPLTLAVGGGSAIDLIKSNTASLNFAAVTLSSCSSTTMTVTGAAVGDQLLLTIPENVLGVATTTPSRPGIDFSRSRVSAANTVTVTACNTSSTASTANPAAGTFRATVVSF